MVVCRVRVALTRLAHLSPGFDPSVLKGKASQVYAPRFPAKKEEQWYFLLADPSRNAVLSCSKLPLMPAEAAGAKYGVAWVSGSFFNWLWLFLATGR